MEGFGLVVGTPKMQGKSHCNNRNGWVSYGGPTTLYVSELVFDVVSL